MAAASLVVRISADINDFSTKLNKMTRDVDRAGDKVAGIGKKLTLGITLPVAAAAVALSKMAAENEDAAGRMERVFGHAASAMDGSIKEMMRSIPEAETELQQMAVSVQNALVGMDLAPDKAANMSAAVLKLSGDLAAFNHESSIAGAEEALVRGLEGKTKGLLQYGIAISEAEIKQRAFKMGILSAGNELTQTGTALATYSLIMERTSRIQGEAARTADQNGKQFAFLKRDLSELADNVSGIVLPAMSGLARSARDLVADLREVPPETVKLIFQFAAAAAVIGPLIVGVSKLAQGYVAIKSAASLLTAGGGLAGFLAGMTNPLGQVLIGVGLLTAAVIGLYAAWKKFKGPSKEDIVAGLDNDPSLAAAVAKFGASPAGANGNTQFNSKDPAAQLKESADAVSAAFEDAVRNGSSLLAIMSRVNQLHTSAAELLGSQSDQFSKEARTGREVADQMQRLKDILAVANAAPGAERGILNGIMNRPFNVGVAGATSAVDAAEAYRRDLATRAAASAFGTPFDASTEAKIKSRNMISSSADDLALREELLQLPDGFNAARQAAIELAEEQRFTAQQSALAYEKIKGGLEGFGLRLGNLSTGMQGVVVNLFNAATSLAQSIASRLGGSGPTAGLLGGIGGIAGGALLGAKFGTAFGPLGTALGGIAGSLIGGLFDRHKKTVDDSASALDKLARTTERVNEALSNLPQGFKIARDRYLATIGVPAGSGDGTGGSSTGGDDSGRIVVNGDLHVNGVNVSSSSSLIRAITDAAKSNQNRGGAAFLIAAQRA
jgi:hypothetical protein